MEKHLPFKFSPFKFNRSDRLFMAVVAVLMFVKVTVDAFSLYSNNVRAEQDRAWWVPFVEQYSSFVLMALGLPFIVWAVRRFPIKSKEWLKHVSCHFGFSVIFFVVHVLGFIALRKIIFPLFGDVYIYGGWPKSALLEYPLDLSTYLTIAVSYIVIIHLSGAKPDKEKAVELNCGSRSIWVKPSEVIFAKAAGNYVDVVLHDKIHLVRSTLEDLQTLINERGGDLRRVHRSTLVNPDHIRERVPVKNGSRKLTMSNKDEITMSRRYAKALD